MSALPLPGTPARIPSDRAETCKEGSEFRTPGSHKQSTGETASRVTHQRAPSTRKRRLDDTGAFETPASKRHLPVRDGADERSDKVTHDWEPIVQRTLEQAFIDGEVVGAAIIRTEAQSHGYAILSGRISLRRLSRRHGFRRGPIYQRKTATLLAAFSSV